MAFNPSSTINLCYVGFDNSYKNVVWFDNLNEQHNYFSGKAVKTFADYLTVRESLPDGSTRSAVKVNASIDSLRLLPCNYMYYQNPNLSNKIFYAFITEMVYVSEGTTKIYFETDVFQTYLFDTVVYDSYVVREHGDTDVIGDNIVPEKFTFQDFVYDEAKKDGALDEWGYLIASSENILTDNNRGKVMSGVYQGLYFYYYHNANNLNLLLNQLEDEGGDCIVFIALIPKFSISKSSLTLLPSVCTSEDEGYLSASTEPATTEVEIYFSAPHMLFNGYKPKNNKCYTSPYVNLIVSNHNGSEAEYNIEDFDIGNAPDMKYLKFKMYGDISANPSVTLIPQNYKNLTENYDAGISISGFPQCSFNSDTFKLWLAKNQYGVALDTVGNIGNIVMGIASMSTGVGAGVGAMQMMNGVQGVLGTMNSVYQASKEPNRSHAGNAKNNLLTAMGRNKFGFYWRKLKKEHIKTIDDFFTMYGYQTNKVKKPNLSSRPYFNYVQTIDVNLHGGIPSDDLERLRAVYNNGVTIWKKNATIGDYSVDNSPS